jgi:hypothetical protein
VFTLDNNGPFWMTPQQRELNRIDRLLPPAPRMRNKTIAELKAELGPLGVLNDSRQYRHAELQQIARDKNLDTRVERTRDRKGWEGQPKGLLQVLWEQGWIDEGQLQRYTIDIAKDNDCEV